MKYLLKALALILVTISISACSSSSNKFNELGLDKLKLGMQIDQVKKIVSFSKEITDDAPNVDVIYDNYPVTLSFYNDEYDTKKLFGISTEYKDALIEGVTEKLIGKSFKEVQNLLKDNLVAIELDEVSTEYFKYLRNNDARKNDTTSCVLYFDHETKKLISISAALNP